MPVDAVSGSFAELDHCSAGLRSQLPSLEGGGAHAEAGDEAESDNQSKDREHGNAFGGRRGVREGAPQQIDCNNHHKSWGRECLAS